MGEIHLIISHPLTVPGQGFILMCPHFGVQGFLFMVVFKKLLFLFFPSPFVPSVPPSTSTHPSPPPQSPHCGLCPCVVYVFKLLETSVESGCFGRKESSARGLRPTGEVLVRPLPVGSRGQVCSWAGDQFLLATLALGSHPSLHLSLRWQDEGPQSSPRWPSLFLLT